MARINIEEKWWTDPRRQSLCDIIGDSYKVDGIFLRLIKIAQENIKNGELIPVKLFKQFPFNDVFISCGICEIKDDGVYLSGTNEHLAWIEQKSKAGKAGATKRWQPHTSVIKNDGNRIANASSRIASSSSSSSSSKEKKEELVAQPLPKLAILWNEHTKLSKIKGCSSKRKSASNERWKETPSEQYWIDTINKLNESSFCNGKNDRSWKADFDFFIKPDTHHKINEGKFDDRKPKNSISDFQSAEHEAIYGRSE